MGDEFEPPGLPPRTLLAIVHPETWVRNGGYLFLAEAAAAASTRTSSFNYV